MNRGFWTLVGRALARSGRLTDALLSLLHSASPADLRLHNACGEYLDRADGVGNDDPATNGELWLLRHLMPRCSVAFDVGANRGDWSAEALVANDQLQLHCFEPSAATFQVLLNRRLPRVARYNNVGLSSERRQAALFVFDVGSGLNSLYRRTGLEDGWGLASPDAQEWVDLITLDGYCEEAGVTEIDYLKLDVEGHELEVLNGGRRMFEAGRVKYGHFEYGGCNIDSRSLLQDFFGWFAAVDYRLFKLLPNRLVPAPRYDQRFENFKYQNWVFMRHDLSI